MLETIGRLPLYLFLGASLVGTAFLAFSWGKPQYLRNRVYTVGSDGNGAGYFLAASACAPLIPLFLLYAWFGSSLLLAILFRELPDFTQQWSGVTRSLFIDQITYQANNNAALPSGVAIVDAAGQRYAQIQGQLRLGLLVVAGSLAFFGYLVGWRQLSAGVRLGKVFERVAHAVLFFCAAIAILVTAGIVTSLIVETVHFFSHPDGPTLSAFLFGTNWNAQSGQSFGVLPLLFGTFLIAIIALIVAVPVGLFCAIYLSEYAEPRVRESLKPLLEILAGIPTVVYGFFAALLIAPLIRNASQWINALPITPDNFLAAQPTSALAAGLIMGVMIIPLMSSLTDDILRTIPKSLRDGALAMGSTKAEMITRIVLPAALPGIVAALLLSASRAIGETMIVVMAAGGRAILTLDPTSDMTTVTHQIVTILTGDTSFDSARTLSAFALGFSLFCLTFLFNVIALRVVRSYRVRYE